LFAVSYSKPALDQEQNPISDWKSNFEPKMKNSIRNGIDNVFIYLQKSLSADKIV
jgi:hypothetical protein